MQKYIPIITSKIRVLLGCLLLFAFGSCYDNYDNTETEEQVIDLPAIKTNADLSGSLITDTGDIISDYELRINEDVFEVSQTEFKVSLANVNKINQLIRVYKDDALLSLANLPLLAGELHTVSLHPLTQVEEVVVQSGQMQVTLDNVVTINISGDDLLAEDVVNFTYSKATEHLGYTGVVDGERLVLDHELTFVTDLFDKANLDLIMQVDILAIEETTAFGLFVFDRVTQLWTLVQQIESTNQTINVPFNELYSLAYFTPCIILEGQLDYNSRAITYQEVEIINPSLSESYKHYSTHSGRFIGFLEENTQPTLAINQCEMNNQSVVTTQQMDLSQSVNLDQGDYNFLTISTEVVDCNSTSQNDHFTVLNVNDEKHILRSAEEINVIICDNETIALESTLENGDQFTLPWEADLVDPIVFMPQCNSMLNGFSHIEIKGQEKSYPPFTIQRSEGQIILTAQDGSFQLILRDDKKGLYSVEQVGLVIDDPGFGDQGFAVSCGTSQLGCGLDYCHVTHLDQGWFRVSFSGTVWMQTLAGQITAGNYPVRGNILIQQ